MPFCYRLRMHTLRLHDYGKEVARWQNFLRGQDLYSGVVDGHFGPQTESATINFQTALDLEVDGVVGNKTFAAAMLRGFEVIKDHISSSDGPNWPPYPTLKPLVGVQARQRLFGKFEYKHAENPNDPEAIVILGNWVGENIEKVVIPQLRGISGAPQSGEIFIHRLARDPLVNLFKRWEQEGLMPLVFNWAGSWVPRFIRGSRTALSNHAFGTAFDLNAGWNPLGVQPPLRGKKGSVRELVPIANELGWYWGGHFKDRPDGMHIELAKL